MRLSPLRPVCGETCFLPNGPMITVCRAAERRRSEGEWLTFHSSGGLADRLLAPRALICAQPYAQAEVVTYVVEGALTYEDSVGRSGVVHAGEFQRVSVERGIRHRETNASSTDPAHVLQIALRSPEHSDHPHEQKRFTAAERRNVLCLIASPDGRAGSLRLHQDVRMYAAVLACGYHLVRELLPGHRAWIHVVSGACTLHDILLAAGDGAGVELALSASFTARAESEILLIDLGTSCA